MTQKQAMAIIRSYGFSVSVKDKEYRITNKERGENGAYYTDDKEDAVNTAKLMYFNHPINNKRYLDEISRICLEGKAIADSKNEFKRRMKQLLLTGTLGV